MYTAEKLRISKKKENIQKIFAMEAMIIKPGSDGRHE